MTQFKQEVFHYQQQRHFVQINCTTLDEQDSLFKKMWYALAQLDISLESCRGHDTR